MIDRATLISDLRKQVVAAETDLNTQLHTLPEVKSRLHDEWTQAHKLGRTAASESAWHDERISEVALAWVLGTVFVRFCEDNQLIPEPYLTGPTAGRRDLAQARYVAYVESDPEPTYRGWLLRAFTELGAGQAGRLLFDPTHNPLYQLPLSHDGARALIEFWREHDEHGDLVHDFTDPLDADGIHGWGTGFLGDLYQDLSENARKTYALLQTPEFIEEFILDRTLEPAIREFGYQKLEMIDPSCGSGHFVLGAFRRLARHWAEDQPTTDRHTRVRHALNSVHGVDINPFAIAIARFRLLVAAMAAANVRTLAEAAHYEWSIQLAVGDSLIMERHQELTFDNGSGSDLAEFSYATEDVQEYPDILKPGRYHVVVGNPPYLTVKDPSLNALYRVLYSQCIGKYALTVPFIVRFFELARNDTYGAGFVGLLSSNSFMKREFGQRLVEQFFPTVDLAEVIDTSGAYIPGHGTPTVLLFGRNRPPTRAAVRTVIGLLGESTMPDHPEQGLVWQSIRYAIDRESGDEDLWTQRVDVDKPSLWKFPWTLADRDTIEILRDMESTGSILSSIALRIGFFAIAGANDVLLSTAATYRRNRVESDVLVPVLRGSDIRDWIATPEEFGVMFKDSTPEPNARTFPNLYRMIWPYRTSMRHRPALIRSATPAWYRWSHVTEVAGAHPWWIAFTWVSTHNHFAVLRDRVAPLNSAPIIRLPNTVSNSDVLQLTSLLNSSLACFWIKQNSNSKGQPGVGQIGIGEPWAEFFEFAGNRLGQLPLPDGQWFQRQWTIYADTIDALTRELMDTDPRSLLTKGIPPNRTELDAARTRNLKARARLIGLQEELDWEIYERYGLINSENRLLAPAGTVPEIKTGERAFEIVLARRIARGESDTLWFEINGAVLTTSIPSDWPEEYRKTVERRIEFIERRRGINRVEQPTFKRRWNGADWDSMLKNAVRSALLDRMENRELWFDENDQPTILSLSRLVDRLARDKDFMSLTELYAPGTELTKVVADLITEEHVPFLSVLRYKPSGLKKRAHWDQVWAQQREEDTAGDEAAKRKIREGISIPPQYMSSDFLRTSYWQTRGKLDVPNERFISYGSTNVATPELYGWAGWDHLQQAQALAAYCTNQSLSTEEITPLLAGLLELQPWLNQWHNDYDDLYNGSPAAFFAGYRQTVQGEHSLSDDDLHAWRPPIARRGRPRKKAD
ncbi:BREX-2 system adenine-specific DNA-methyltransferase PglX [Nocardia sp. NPDC049526]|uniref:BREX-2 system adenine-specific DNA-methyltransferase PglX n=1 Tax=Nocardia sp. NPDC049526 TaxID=3364316 RepID=UPI0037B86D57